MVTPPASTSNGSEKMDVKHDELAPAVTNAIRGDFDYTDEDEEPVLHHRTYIALLSLFILNFVQVVALNGPASILHHISHDVGGAQSQTWVPNALSLVQAVLGPVISFASDTFQVRKILLMATCTVSFIGAAIAPGANNIYRVIVAQILVGVGFAAVPLAYAIPSEIVPRRWRPVILGVMNVAAQLGALAGSIGGGALTKHNAHTGWRNLYWLQMGLWGAAVIGIFFGYSPPKRHTRLDHLSFWQKLGKLDLPGMGLLAWTNVRVLASLIIGIVFLIAFGLYEWKGTSHGVLHHELFQLRTFPLSIGLMFIEGIMLFSIVVFYPQLTAKLFETDPLLAALRAAPYWIGAALGSAAMGFWSFRMRTIRSPMLAGFVIFVGGLVGMATLQPGQSANAIAFDAVAGFGYGSPLVLIVAGVQLATPHHLIATATAVLTSTRAVAASTFTAIYGAAYAGQAKTKLPKAVAKAATGLASQYVTPFVEACIAGNTTAIEQIPGVTPQIVKAGLAGVLQGEADSYRVVWIIAVAFGVLACGLVWFLDDMRSLMNYRVDAPVEELHARHHHDDNAA